MEETIGLYSIEPWRTIYIKILKKILQNTGHKNKNFNKLLFINRQIDKDIKSIYSLKTAIIYKLLSGQLIKIIINNRFFRSNINVQFNRKFIIYNRF